MSLNGGWVSYGGDAKIELAAGLVSEAGCAAYAGTRLRRPVRAVRPPAPVAVLNVTLWVIALIAFATALTNLRPPIRARLSPHQVGVSAHDPGDVAGRGGIFGTS